MSEHFDVLIIERLPPGCDVDTRFKPVYQP